MSASIIGLGSMGLGMSSNIIRAGIPLRGYDTKPSARRRFAALGGVLGSSASDAARDSDLLVVMVVNASQANDVLFGCGVADALSPGATVVLCSTVSPSDVREIADRLESFGVGLVDAPVSGGSVGAEAGTLTVMASGGSRHVRRAKKLLGAISGKVYYLGDVPGIGATYKTVHQLAAGVHLVAAAELFALGSRAGCDPETLFDIVTRSSGCSWMLSDRGPRILDDDYSPRSTIDIFIKDLGLVLETGRDLGVPLPLASSAYQMLVAASGLGHSGLDDSAVIKSYESVTGVSSRRRGGKKVSKKVGGKQKHPKKSS